MCKCKRIFRNVTLEKCSKISFVFNLSLTLLNITIIIFTSLCFIQDKYDIILKTEMMSYINNIFFCVIMISFLILIEFYRCKKFLIKRKIKSSLILMTSCTFISAIKIMDVFDSITKINRYMLLFNFKKNSNIDFVMKLTKQINKQKTYLIIILVIFTITFLLYIFYAISLFNMSIIYMNINFNNAQNDDKISNISTEVDISNDNNENNISDINIDKIKYKYYLSENIMNKIEKEYKDKMTQTIAK